MKHYAYIVLTLLLLASCTTVQQKTVQYIPVQTTPDNYQVSTDYSFDTTGDIAILTLTVAALKNGQKAEGIPIIATIDAEEADNVRSSLEQQSATDRTGTAVLTWEFLPDIEGQVRIEGMAGSIKFSKELHVQDGKAK